MNKAAAARTAFLEALQSLMREHGVRGVLATFDGEVLVQFRDRHIKAITFAILEPETKIP